MRTGNNTHRYTTKARIKSPITDQASRPQRAARATNGFEKKGPRSAVIGDPNREERFAHSSRGAGRAWVDCGTVLPTVPVPPRHVDDLLEAAGEEAIERLRSAAAPLMGARILQVNSTAFGGGVAELLYTQVALLNDLGIETHWQVIEGSEEFFGVTKAVHNALQGAEVGWSDAM